MRNRFGDPYVPAPVVGTPEHLATMADIARRSITELRNSALPLRTGQNVLVTGWGVSTRAGWTSPRDRASSGHHPYAGRRERAVPLRRLSRSNAGQSDQSYEHRTT
jgi:hypothetical protein